MTADTKEFKNPSGYWRHEGDFSVELTEDGKKMYLSLLPNGAKVHGNTVIVKHGRIAQSMGGIDFYANEVVFGFAYHCIKTIRDQNGQLIWVNDQHR